MKINIESLLPRLSRLAATLAVLVVLLLPQTASAVTSQSLAVPLYGRPDSGTFWDDITRAGSGTVPFVVANPRNGPGSMAEAPYTAAINKNATNNVRTFGYVQTNYQARNFKEAYNDIDTWYRLYPNIKGVFIDLVKEGSTSEVCYVAALYTHIKNIRPNDAVVLGPGGHISAAYEPYGDIFVNAASDYGTYQTWKAQYPGFEDKPLYQNRFWHIIHGVSSDEYSNAFDLVRGNNAGWTYITDKTVPTPFSEAPSFWQNEISDVANLPASSIPNRGKTALPRGCISLSASADTVVDTTVPKQSNSKSAVTVNNTSQSYDSEPATQMQLLSAPAGASMTGITGDGWACTGNIKPPCSYSAALAASSSTKLEATFQAGCDLEGGDAVLRLINYAGNQWDLKVPIKPPIGCDPSTAAGKLNPDTTGQVISLTTESVETTPDITPLGGTQATPDNGPQTSKKALSPLKIALIIVLGVLVLGIVTLILVMLHQRRRYKVNL